jgi:predicted house-cleaning noncanonical NTP pyrophosphatase (MazG superfamily)
VKHFDKLVRDGIPEYLTNKGLKSETRIVRDDELIRYLKQKLVEEAQEVEASNNPLEELGDMYEVMLALLQRLDLDWSDVQTAAEQKRLERGGFDHGIVLDTVE